MLTKEYLAKHFTPLYEAYQAVYPVLSNTPSTGETVVTDDSWMEECGEAGVW